MKKFLLVIFLIFIFPAICFANENNSSNNIQEKCKSDSDNTDFLYKYYVLDRIDSSDIPDNVKQYANNNNCFKIMKKYYWSNVIFQNNGGIYSCYRDNKLQYIYDNQKELRFAKWYEKRKFKKIIIEN